MTPPLKIKIDVNHLLIKEKCDFYSEYYKFDSHETVWFKNRKSSWRHFNKILQKDHRLVPDQPHTWPECAEILKQISPYFDQEINWSWYTIMLCGGEFPPHAHPSMIGLTGVYYPYCDATNPVFEYFTENKWVEIKVKTGDFLLFPNTLIHRVPLNTSKNNRYSIGFGHFVSFDTKTLSSYYEDASYNMKTF